MRKQKTGFEEQASLRLIRFAAMQTVPVLFGYAFLGVAFGILLQKAGYSWIWALASSVLVYAGSMQFVLVTLLTQGAGLLYTAVMTFFINGRHIFYGLSFLAKYRDCGKLRPYLIFSLTDETYSVLCGCKVPEGMSEKGAWFLISLFDQCYWILGSVAGALLGWLLPFDTTGIDFSMTALFVVMLMEQCKDRGAWLPAGIGALAAAGCLLLFGPDRFLLPALAVSTALLLSLRGLPKRRGGAAL